MQPLRLFILLLFLPLSAAAEQSKTFGDYIVHYSVFTTDYLTAEVAKLYQIPRSKNRALVNISVLKKNSGPMGEPVRARVEGAATNLSAQLRELNIREINENNAVYYIAETQINNEETLRYDFNITPEGESDTFQLSFQEKFYIN